MATTKINILKSSRVDENGNCYFFLMLQFGHVNLSLSTNNQTLLRAVTIFSEGIFDGETLVVHPKLAQVSNSLKVALISPKNIPYDIHIRVSVSIHLNDTTKIHTFQVAQGIRRINNFGI